MNKTVSLSQVCNIITGKLDANAANENGKYPFFTCAPEPLAIDYFAYDGDVILIAGNNAAGNFHVSRFKGKFNAYQRTYILTTKSEEQDLDYIFYSLKLELQNLRKKSQGSQTKFLTLPLLSNLEIKKLDPLLEKKIASILKNIDAKIELNNKINAELEAMAKTIYDYWFVQFDFPDEDGKPYKSSGGKMAWNEAIKRDIPADWTDGVLSSIAKITMGQSPPGESYNEKGNGLPFFQGCTDFGVRFPDVRQYTYMPSRIANPGDILLSVRAPVGSLNIANEKCCIGRGLAALKSNNGYTSYLWGILRHLARVFERRNVDGTTFGAITKDDLFSLAVIKPSEQVLKRFQSATKPAYEMQNKIELENRELIALRDWLLPMLMNGQVKVS